MCLKGLIFCKRHQRIAASTSMSEIEIVLDLKMLKKKFETQSRRRRVAELRRLDIDFQRNKVSL